MTVTSVTTASMSFRTTRFGTSAAADVPVSGEPSTPVTTADSASSPAPVTEPTASTSTVSSRAVALFQRLDADEDGSISKDEFTSGAIDLLKRASVREHHRNVGKGEGIDKRDAKWLARLEGAFDRIDANRDGSVAQDELSAPLARAAAIRRYTAEAAAALPQTLSDAPAPAPTGTTEPIEETPAPPTTLEPQAAAAPQATEEPLAA